MSSGKTISEFLIKTPLKVKVHTKKKKPEPQSTINLREFSVKNILKNILKRKKWRR